MSFKLNPIEFDANGDLTDAQPSFLSSYYGLSERYKRDLKKGWAGQFRTLIMPAINEEPYRVLYSSEPSRANTPVNLCLAAMILKEMKQIPTDDDIRERLCFDMEYRYAVCCENYTQAPLSDNVLTNFRQRCIGYYAETGKDLIHETFMDLTEVLSQFMEIDKTLISIDSTMIAADIKKMNRLDLLYTVNERLIESIVGVRVHKKKQRQRQ